MQEIEQEIVKILLNDEEVLKQSHPIYYWCTSGRDLSKIPPFQNIAFLNKDKDGGFFIEVATEVGNLILRAFLQYASQGNIYSDVEFEINPDGSYTSRYWFDEERLYNEEFGYAMLGANDFPHAAATNLVNYHFFDTKFKRKFTRIHWTMEVKNEEAFFEVYSINKKNQQIPIDVSVNGTQLYLVDGKSLYFEGFWKYKLLEHYEATHNGILKDVWKPWNKIVINIPPNGYLDENEDIAYYLDDVKLEKDFFLRGY